MARPHSGYGGREDYSPRHLPGQQHVINMGGVDAGAASAAYRPPQHSPYTPGAASGSSAGHHSMGGVGGGGGYDGSAASSTLTSYASPRIAHAGGLAPLQPQGSAVADTRLGRSQSLGHAAHQRAHQQQQHMTSPGQQHSSMLHHQQQAQQQQQQPHLQSYTPASYHRSREHAQQYSEGSPSAARTGSLLPTINTQIPSGSLHSSPYSAGAQRASMFVDSSSVYSAQPPMSRSPHQPPRTGGSPYAPHTQLSPGMHYQQLPPQQQQRPASMLDASYAASPRGSFVLPSASSPVQPQHRGMSPGGGHQQAHTALRAATDDRGGLPLHHSQATQLSDSLPYAYSVGGGGSASYADPTYSPQYANAGPPRNSVGAYAPTPSSSDPNRRSSMMAGYAPSSGNDWQQAPPPPKLPQRPAQQEGFRRIRDSGDLKPNLNLLTSGGGRRADPAGGHVSPLKAMTTYLHHTYHLVNPAFIYELSFNPRRVLTKPSKPMHNDGHDNEDSDYILYVNDWLGAEEGNRYLILDVLGQGTFGQVVKCQNMKTHEIVAVKVIKNKPAYFNQSMMEVTILEMLNSSWDPNDEHHILRLRDTFIHAKHLCLVFELLSSNLYELIKQNSFRGLSTTLVRVFTQQLLDALTVLNEARLIHCDLKPENILLKTLQTPTIKLVDFGSACHERQTVYTYIQSRFYRSPEVLLGLPYSSAIDMWSLGCIAVELFLGLPLFPGTSEYNQVCRIVEMLGMPPQYMLESGKQTGEFFSMHTDEYGRKTYRLKSLEQYSKEHNVQEQPSKKYFQATTLPEIVKTYPMARKSGKPADATKELLNRTAFIDFVGGLLQMDPALRWTPQQAKLHPFITGEKYVKPYKPQPAAMSPTSAARAAKASANDAAKHPYGGLPQTPSRSSGRGYQDAAAYNQHLAQQQAYNSAHQARQAQPPPVNNPYAQEAQAQANANAQAQANANAQAQAHAKAQAQVQQHAQAQAHAQAVAHAQATSPGYGDASAQRGNRSRSNTMTRMDAVPPQLAKMGLESSSMGNSIGHSLTPVLNREESMREWERRQAAAQNGGVAQQSAGAAGKQRQSSYQGLDMLQQQPQQGDASGSSGAGSGWTQQWASPSQGNAAQSSFSVVVDNQAGRMMNPHEASGSGQAPGIAQPLPAAYSSNSSGAPAQASRYQPPPGAAYGAVGMSFDPYDTGIAQLMPALKPTQYQGSTAAAPTQRHSMAVAPSSAANAYGGLIPGALVPSPGVGDAFGLPAFNDRRYSQQPQGQQQQQQPPRHAPSPQSHQRF